MQPLSVQDHLSSCGLQLPDLFHGKYITKEKGNETQKKTSFHFKGGIVVGARLYHWCHSCDYLHIVEFFNKYHPDPNDPEMCAEELDEQFPDGMFRFEKVIR